MTSVAVTATSEGFETCCIVYGEMKRRSIPSAKAYGYKQLIPDGVERVFVGSLIALFRDLGLTSLGTYHNHKANLTAMGCVSKLQQGRFEHTESVWALHHAPTYDLWVKHVGQHFRQKDAEIWDAHERALENFLGSAPSLYPKLLQQAAKSGARSREDFLRFLASLPEPTLRSLHPVCLGFAVPGTVHTCMTAPLDPLAPSSHAGSWKRRRDHLRKLQESPSPL